MAKRNIHCRFDKMVQLEKLKPHPKNPNKHPKKQIELLAKIMRDQGVRHPIIVSKRSKLIIKGHGRLDAAKFNKWDDYPVEYQSYKSAALEYADMIADNKIAELAELDLDEVQEGLKEFPDLDLDLLGIPDFSLEEIKEGLTDEDEIPNKAKARVKLGEIYKLGEHRLMCGDSTSISEVEKLMNGEKVDMVFTDIPYNISQKSNGLRELDYGEWDKNVEDIGLKSFYLDIADSFYYFCGDTQLSGLLKLFNQNNLICRSFVWHKTNPTVINGQHVWLPSQELCAYGKKSKAIFNENCKHAFYEGAPNGNRAHPNQKPVELVIKCINASSNDSVLDLFGGSGTTLIACEKTNRICYMMELEPKYCDVIIKRWEDYTGKKAELINAKSKKEKINKKKSKRCGTKKA